MNEKRRKRNRILIIIGIVVLVLVLANWVVPETMIAVESNSKLTKADAQALIKEYDGEASPKAVCRDLVLLRQMHLVPERIHDVKDGKVIYEVEISENYIEYFDVTRSWSGTMYYHNTDDSGGEGTVRIRPWGSTKVY